MPDKEPTPTPCGGGIVVKCLCNILITIRKKSVNPPRNFQKTHISTNPQNIHDKKGESAIYRESNLSKMGPTAVAISKPVHAGMNQENHFKGGL